MRNPSSQSSDLISFFDTATAPNTLQENKPSSPLKDDNSLPQQELTNATNNNTNAQQAPPSKLKYQALIKSPRIVIPYIKSASLPIEKNPYVQLELGQFFVQNEVTIHLSTYLSLCSFIYPTVLFFFFVLFLYSSSKIIRRSKSLTNK